MVLDKVAKAGKEIIVVTKYLDALTAKAVWPQIRTLPAVIGVGENRTASLESKNFPREMVHFIGRLQSRQLPDIVRQCATIHSLASLKHARILNEKTTEPVKIYIQVNVAKDPSKEGIPPEDLSSFLKDLKPFSNLEIAGLSSMGWGEFELEEKQQEFQTLIALRDQYLPGGKTSAGTSRDYEIALEQGIDIVRVGSACFS